ncbi:MAG: copper chaperone PCu(A)C [Chloroflexi bacterium]|nr:MAG: copper chaperone PCu(A)C [Chloroflexota bacterium]MBL1194209.1 copper chaperone PCu(A)C [Chloroflexota bacterium]NOH11502.1 copper chaperone PCu(A)C [Chloroflexota bacterium]
MNNSNHPAAFEGKPTALLVLAILSLFLFAGCSAPVEDGTISIQDAWARPAITGDNSAVYFVIDNPFAQDEVLLSANSELASATELHMTMMVEIEDNMEDGEEAMPGMEDGAMRMMPQENVPIPANTAVSFEPGGLHVMLIDLQEELIEGDMISLTLEFEQAGTIVIELPVGAR